MKQKHYNKLLVAMLLWLFTTHSSIAQTVNAGPDQQVCGTETTLQASENGELSGVWTIIGGSAIIENSTFYNTRIFNLSPGQNVFRWTVEDALYSPFYDDVVIISNMPTQAFAGSYMDVCENSVFLQANQPFIGYGSWQAVNTNAYFVNPEIPATEVGDLQAGENVFVWKIDNNGCVSSDTIIITYNKIDVFLEPEQIICSSTGELIASPLPAGAVGAWTIINGNAVIGDNMSATTIVTNLQPGENIFEWTVELNGCTRSEQTMIVNAMPPITNAGLDVVTCEDFAYLNANVPMEGVGHWETLGGFAVLSNPEDPQAYVENLMPGENTFKWVINNDGCMSSDEVVLTNNSFSVEAGQDFSICDTIANLQAVATDGDGFWSLINGNAIIVDINLHNTEIITHSAGALAFRWSVTRNGCTNHDDVFVMNNRIPAFAGDDQNVCGRTAMLSANRTWMSDGQWSKLRGDGEIIDNQMPNTQVINLGNNVNEFRWALNTNGCITYDDVIIRTAPGQNLTANAGMDQTICADSTILQATAPAIGQGHWAAAHGDAEIVNPEMATTKVRKLKFGPNVFHWVVENWNCQVADDVVINNQEMKAETFPDFTTCTEHVELRANDLFEAQGLWTTNVAGIEIDNPEFPETMAGPLQNGINTFTWTVTTAACTSSSILIITHNQPTTNAGADQTLCVDSVMLSGTAPQPGEFGSWYIHMGGGNIHTPNQYNTKVTYLEPGINIFVWEVWNNEGCYALDDVTITNNGPSPAIAMEDVQICENSVVLYANEPYVGTGKWSITSGGGEIDTPNAAVTEVFSIVAGNNIFQWTTSVGNSGCESTDNVIVTVNSFEANAGTDITVCVDNTILSATASTQGTGTWSVVVGNGTFASQNSYNTAVSNLSNGINVFKWTVAGNGCYAEDFVEVFSNKFVVDAGPDQTITSNVTTLVGTMPSADAEVLWTVTSGYGEFVSMNSPMTEVQMVGVGVNTYVWTVNKGGCVFSDAVTVTREDASFANAGEDMMTCMDNITLSANTPPIGYIGFWRIIQGEGTILNPLNKNTNVTGIGTGENIFRWRLRKNGSVVAFDDVKITNNSVVAYAGEDIINACKGDIQLSANSVDHGIGYWSVTAGNPEIHDSNNNNSLVSINYAGSVTLNWTIENNGCTSNDDITITTVGDFGTGITTTADFTACSNSETISATPSGGTWTKTDETTAVILTPNQAETKVRYIPKGKSSYRYSYFDGTCTTSAVVEIDNQTTPTPFAGLDKTTCNSEILLHGSNPKDVGFRWEVITGSDDLDRYARNTVVSGLVDGVNIYAYVLNTTFCETGDTIIITHQPINAQIITQEEILCNNSTTLEALTPPLGINGQWRTIVGGGTILTPNSNTTQVDNIPRGMNIYQWIIEDNGCMDFKEVAITNAMPETPNAGADQNVCDSIVVLVGNAPMYGWSEWSAVSGSAPTNITNPNSNITEVTGLSQGVYKFTYTITNNYAGTICEASDSVVITNSNIGFTLSQHMYEACGEITIVETSPTANGQWQILGGSALIENPQVFNTTFSNLGYGYNHFIWTTSENGCMASDEITINNAQPNMAFAGQDQEVCEDVAFLNANFPWIGSGEWKNIFGAGNIHNPTDPMTIVDGLQQGTNKFVWTINNENCTSADTVLIMNKQVYAMVAPNITICSDNAQLNATLSSGLTGEWTVFSGYSTIENHNDPQSNVFDLGFGLNSFVWTVTNGMCSDYDILTIERERLHAEFDHQIDGNSVSFFGGASSSGTISYSWNFDDGTTSTQQNPTHLFQHDGVYNVCLSVFSASGCQGQHCMEIIIGDNCQTSFDYEITTDGNIQFSGYSQGTPDEWYWTFGDGTVSNEQNPVHEFNNARVFDVCLSSSNSTTGCASQKCEPVFVGNQCYIQSAFSYYVANDGVTINLEDESGGDISHRFWTFGDGATSTTSNPTHTYNAPGFYLITLSVRDSANNCMDFYSDFVLVGQADCASDFDYNVQQNNNDTVAFNNLSTGENLIYFWEFGDGNFSIEESPKHKYQDHGLYSVTLIVSNPNQTCFDISFKDVQVGTVDCNAEFTYYVDSITNTAFFQSELMGTASTFYWEFGDGQTATMPNPVHHYMHPGFYTISLTVFNDITNCMDTYFSDVIITNQGNDVYANFIHQYDPTTGEVQFFDRSMGNGLTYSWNFDFNNEGSTDSNPIFTYTTNGFYNVCLSVEDQNGGHDMRCRIVRAVQPNGNDCHAEFQYVVDSLTKTISLIDASFGEIDQWEWNVGDGTIYENMQEVQHTYADSGHYDVRLDISNSTTGCQSTYFDVVNVGAEAGLASGFIYDVDTTGNSKEGYPTDFVGGSFGNPSSASWSYGDKSEDEGTLTPTHVFAQPGFYDVTFTIADPITGQESSTTKQIEIKDITTGLGETQTEKPELSIYPNPAKSFATINMKLVKSGKVELSIFDANGKKHSVLVKTYRTDGTYNYTIDVSNLKSGLYFVALQTNGNVITKQFIVTK